MGEAVHGGERIRSIWEISVPSPQFCCEHKTVLKYKILVKIFIGKLG